MVRIWTSAMHVLRPVGEVDRDAEVEVQGAVAVVVRRFDIVLPLDDLQILLALEHLGHAVDVVDVAAHDAHARDVVDASARAASSVRGRPFLQAASAAMLAGDLTRLSMWWMGLRA